MSPRFAELFGRAPEVSAEAPGRVNLIGEHTDYNGGYVLPVASPQTTRVDLAARSDDEATVHSMDVPIDQGCIHYHIGEETRHHDWGDYVQGVTAALGAEGISIPGFDARIESDLPLGGGLSSSASLCVALLRALRQARSLPLDDVQLALLAQRAETDFVGARVGVMDPMAASLGNPRAALFLDARTLAHELVPLPDALGLAVIDSGIPHENRQGQYQERRRECERASRLLGVTELRDVSPADLPRAAGLPVPLDRRVRHVVTENERVLAAVGALRSGDIELLGRLVDLSHESMKTDYEVSTPEMDLLVDLARDQEGVLGARMIGGGAGGGVLVICEPGKEAVSAERAASAFRARTGRPAAVLIPKGIQ